MKVSKQEFWLTMTDPKTKDRIRTAYNTGYIYFFMNTYLSLVVNPEHYPLLVEGELVAIVILVLSLGIHKLRSRVCACLMLGFYVAVQVCLIISELRVGLDGAPGYLDVGRIIMLILFASTFYLGVKGTFRYQKDWILYQEGTNDGAVMSDIDQ